MDNAAEETMHRRTGRGGYAAAGMAVLAVMVVLGLLAAQLTQELTRLRSAPNDNLQWSMSQLQVELLVLQSAIDLAAHRQTPETLDDVRQRFDIFYSRIDTLRHGRTFEDLASRAEVSQTLDRIEDAFNREIPAIDGSDEALGQALPALYGTVGALVPQVRQIALAGVRVLAERSDGERQAFANLLVRTGLVTAGVLAAMFLVLFMFLRQFRIARVRTGELQTQNRLYESAINASLEAIIVSDENGRILDFNTAAEWLFGYKRENALGVTAEKLVIPPDARTAHCAKRAQLLRQLGPKDVHVSERLEIEAMRADGTTFPAEVSVGLTRRNEGRLIVTYMRDISGRKRAQETLMRMRDDAVATAKAKSDFLAVMSHEMRTPLNGIMGLLDMLSETRLTRKQRDYVETAISSAEILQRHTDDVLDITRIEAGATKPAASRFDVKPLLTEVKKMNDPAAAARGNAIEIAGDVESFQQDRHGLRQVLINLVGNAVKFTENGTIGIECRPIGSEGWVEFSVSDTGIGIDDADTGRIFDDFVMLDPSYRRTAPGSGLGLGICRRIVGMMGGEIGVDSEVGRGSRFWLRLPPLAVAERRPSEPIPAERGDPAALPAALSVLLVEDNETNRFVAREMLVKHGCTVTEAHDGIAGVELAAANAFDVIFMDVSMPRLDGIGATQAIREGGGLSRETPIIALTAHALPEERRRLEEVGMKECIIKPLRSARISDVINRLLHEQTAAAPAGPAFPLEDLLDRETLAELIEALPDDLFQRQFERFRHEIERAGPLCEAPNTLALDTLAAEAHKIAGSAAVFGACALRAALLEIEIAARRGDREDLARLCDDAKSLAAETLAALSSFAIAPAPVR